MLQDQFGRKINYARLSVTDLCNLRCMYCMGGDGVKKLEHHAILRIEDILEAARALVSLGIDKVRVTGGEPLVRKGIMTLISELSGMEGIKDLSMTTNGLLLHEHVENLKKSGLHRLNISLDSLHDDKYRHITRGGELKDALKGVQSALEGGFKQVKINVVLIKGFNDDEINDFIDLTIKHSVDVRFIELMPIGSQHFWTEGKFLPASVVLESRKELISAENPETKDYASSAVYYKLPQAKGRVGLIRPLSCKFCENCNRIRLTADGKIKSCLHSDKETDIKGALGNFEALKSLIVKAVSEKPKAHKLEEGTAIKKDMSRIGG